MIPDWWAVRDLNTRPSGCKPDALTAELTAQPFEILRYRYSDYQPKPQIAGALWVKGFAYTHSLLQVGGKFHDVRAHFGGEFQVLSAHGEIFGVYSSRLSALVWMPGANSTTDCNSHPKEGPCWIL
jgi:hypothetical protein